MAPSDEDLGEENVPLLDKLVDEIGSDFTRMRHGSWLRQHGHTRTGFFRPTEYALKMWVAHVCYGRPMLAFPLGLETPHGNPVLVVVDRLTGPLASSCALVLCLLSLDGALAVILSSRASLPSDRWNAEMLAKRLYYPELCQRICELMRTHAMTKYWSQAYI